MKLPTWLNPLRGTTFAWLVPFTWAVIKFAAKAAPTTIEVFLHHRFGARTGQALLKGFLLLFVISAIAEYAGRSAAVHLFPMFLFAYVVAALGHWIISQRSRQTEHIHSYLHGEPWPFWEVVPVETTTVQQYLEPACCCMIASVVFLIDPALAHWLFFATIALFVKEQMLRAELRTRRLDSFDNRIETERLSPRARPENEPFVEARAAPPQSNRPRRGPS